MIIGAVIAFLIMLCMGIAAVVLIILIMIPVVIVLALGFALIAAEIAFGASLLSTQPLAVERVLLPELTRAELRAHLEAQLAREGRISLTPAELTLAQAPGAAARFMGVRDHPLDFMQFRRGPMGSLAMDISTVVQIDEDFEALIPGIFYTNLQIAAQPEIEQGSYRTLTLRALRTAQLDLTGLVDGWDIAPLVNFFHDGMVEPPAYRSIEHLVFEDGRLEASAGDDFPLVDWVFDP